MRIKFRPARVSFLLSSHWRLDDGQEPSNYVDFDSWSNPSLFQPGWDCWLKSCDGVLSKVSGECSLLNYDFDDDCWRFVGVVFVLDR